MMDQESLKGLNERGYLKSLEKLTASLCKENQTNVQF